MRHNPLIRAVTVLVAAATFASCGGSSDDDTTTAASSTSVGARAAEPTEGDVEYVRAMVGHNEQAIELAEYAADPNAGAAAEVKKIAATIAKESEADLVTLKGWLTAWGEEATAGSMGDGGGHSMAGMTTPEDLANLATLKATEFDTEWITLMIAHHEGAASMATPLANDDGLADVEAYATSSAARQKSQIKDLQALLTA